MTRGSFFASVVWTFCLTTVSSFTSAFVVDCGFCLSGEAVHDVDFPLPPPSGFLSRSFIPSAGAGGEYFCGDFPSSMVLSNATARDNHGGCGAVFICLPPRRFLIPFSTYEPKFYPPPSNDDQSKSLTSSKASGVHQSRAIRASTSTNPAT